MLKDDPLAKDLFMEFNGSPMSNMNLTEEQARAVLEYFRTL
jgi:cytochrome c